MSEIRAQDISIREVAEEDLAAVLGLYRAAGIGADTEFTIQEAREHFATFARYPFFRVYIARLGDTAVGTYELLILDSLAKRGRKSGVVEAVAVDPKFQGHGIGRAMMEHARELCHQAQCYKLSLSSNLVREDAHRFYEALGFERHGYSFRLDPANTASGPRNTLQSFPGGLPSQDPDRQSR